MTTKDAHARDVLPTQNPHTGKQIVCFREGSSQWAWVDDTNISLYSAAKGRLLELGIDPTVWEYTEAGRVYNLPEPLVFRWEQRISKNGRPYKEAVGISPIAQDVDSATVAASLAALASAFEDAPVLEIVPKPESAAQGLLPEVAEAPADELARIAPLLGAANRAIDDLGAKTRELEQAAMDKVREDNLVLYERLDAATAKRDELTKKARKLLELHQATGARGRILNGWYTLMRSETQTLCPKFSEGHLLRWLLLNMPHLLRMVVKIDLKAMYDLTVHQGKLLSAFAGMPVEIATLVQEGSRIEWSKLPEMVTEDAPTAPVEEAAANGHKESAGDSSPERFPAD